MKTCSKCGVEKDESEFSKANHHKDGLRSQCKKCRSEYQKEYQKSDKRKESEKRRNKSDKRKEWEKKRRQSDKRKEYMKEYQKEYVQSDKYKEYQKKRRKLEDYKNRQKEYQKSDKYKEYQIAYNLKSTTGVTPPPELVEVKLIINKTKQLCKTLKS